MNAPLRTGASLARGKSKQDYGTPGDFLGAVQVRFGDLFWDLAATKENSVCGENHCYTPEHDSKSRDWTAVLGLAWLNPPYANIAPWARKCAESAGPQTRILLLVPAAVGSNWFAEWVHPYAMVYALRPRPMFVGSTDPYPKDLMLCCYGFGVTGFSPWKWREPRKSSREKAVRS